MPTYVEMIVRVNVALENDSDVAHEELIARLPGIVVLDDGVPLEGVRIVKYETMSSKKI